MCIRDRFKTRTFQNLTDDYYDDLDATICTLDGKKGILFVSNRPEGNTIVNPKDSIFPVGHFKVFFLNTVVGSEKKYTLITEENGVNLRYPNTIDNQSIIYFTSVSGVNNLQEFNLETKTKKPITNLDRNAIRYHVSPVKEKLLTTYYHNGQYKICLLYTSRCV